jgi:hypothetical protein
MGLGGGALFFVFGRYGFIPERPPKGGYHSLFLGRSTHWPHFVQSFLPLDLALTMLAMAGILYLLLERLPRSSDADLLNWRGFAKYAAGAFVGGGCLGLLGASTFGWYLGLEDFLLMGGAVLALFVGLGGLMVGIFLAVQALSRRSRASSSA